MTSARLTEEQLEKILKKSGFTLSGDGAGNGTKANKYGAKKTVSDGIKFDSKAEEKRYHELKVLEQVGEIRDLEVHVTFELGPEGTEIWSYVHSSQQLLYTCDFMYWDIKRDREVIEDVKGVVTEAAALRISVFESLHKRKVNVVKRQ